MKDLGTDEQLSQFLGESMKTWRVELTYGEQMLGEVKIKRGTSNFFAVDRTERTERTERQSEEEEGKEKSEVVGEWTTNHLHGSSLQVSAAKCSRSFY